MFVYEELKSLKPSDDNPVVLERIKKLGDPKDIIIFYSSNMSQFGDIVGFDLDNSWINLARSDLKLYRVRNDTTVEMRMYGWLARDTESQTWEFLLESTDNIKDLEDTYGDINDRYVRVPEKDEVLTVDMNKQYKVEFE